MNAKTTSRTLSRRAFLGLLGLGGAAAASGYVLYEYAPWLNYEQQAGHDWRAFEQPAAGPAQWRELIRYATLAANGHNTQPWKFALKESAIEIHPDTSRRLPAVDPDDRELWISLGCALENLLVAARAAGYAAEVAYPEAADVIVVRLAADAPQSSPLFDAIPLRQTTRSDYDGQPVPAAVLDQAARSLAPGVSLHFLTSPGGLEMALEYVNEGNLSQYADRAFVGELTHWLRFNQKDALAAADGLFSRCSGNPEVPAWLGRMFVASTNPQQQADADAKKLRSSAGVAVIASESDDKTAWVRAGQMVERLALTLTAANIKSAFLNQPIEVAAVRGQFQSALGIGSAQPQLLVRFGYADAMPRSLRRPVAQVLI